MPSDSDWGRPDPGPGQCSVFLHADMFTSTASSQIFLLQIGETMINTKLSVDLSMDFPILTLTLRGWV